MNEQQALAKMYGPSDRRPGKPHGSVIQIWTTNVCNLSCWGCTQAGNLKSPRRYITPEQFGQACESLRGFWGTVGMFGANPALHPEFKELCRVFRASPIPKSQRGIWCNDPITLENVQEMRETFNPARSNLNVHLDKDAWDLFRQGWPESRPFGLKEESRHSPPFVAMKDVLRTTCNDCCNGWLPGTEDENGEEIPAIRCQVCEGTGRVYDEEKAWELISGCDINRHWSALVGVFRGELRAWFCEIAGAQAILHQDDPCSDPDGWHAMTDQGAVSTFPCSECYGTGKGYPDTGLDPTTTYEVEVRPGERLERTTCRWWELPMQSFAHQVRKHCHECGIPLRGKGALACETGLPEQTSGTHAAVFTPKRGKEVQVVGTLDQLGTARLENVVRYLQNAKSN